MGVITGHFSMKIIKPEAHILYAPMDGLEVVYAAARRCYFAGDSKEFLEEIDNSTDRKRESLIRMCIRSGHESVLEHVSFTFHITCSRSASHQLVRHRIASYSQQSQRYCRMENMAVILPEAMDRDMDVEEELNMIEARYKARVEEGVAPEDARAVLPNCVATHIVMTMNCRQLLHFFSERCCNRAQAEIRSIANQMLELVKQHEPVIFEFAGPKCIKIGRCPERVPCGERPWR